MRPVTLRFKNCSPNDSREDGFLIGLVKLATGREVVVVTDGDTRVDLQFTSVQVPSRVRVASMARNSLARRLRRSLGARDGRWQQLNPAPRGPAASHIWFTGENVRPPYGEWSGYLSFDIDPMSGRNAYLPLWMYSTGLLGNQRSVFTSANMHWSALVKPRSIRPPERFACAFINNPHPQRMRAIQYLNEVSQVDVFGSWNGRQVPDKAVVARNYRFVLSFENDLFPGYVTEKPFEAWASGSVPLWWGLDPLGYLNSSAMVTANSFASLAEFAEAVRELDRDRQRWQELASSPILAREPDIRSAVDLVRRQID